METQNFEITVPDGFENAELRDLYRTRIKFLEGIIEAATSRGDIDEIVRTKAEIQQVTDAINAIT